MTLFQDICCIIVIAGVGYIPIVLVDYWFEQQKAHKELRRRITRVECEIDALLDEN